MENEKPKKNFFKKPKNRKNKIVLVFDEDKRKEFLTGFHKRKLQRKKQAKEKLEEQLKEERKRLKQEARESYKKLVVSHKPIPELEHLFVNEYEVDDVSVKVTELSTVEIAKHNNWIGENRPMYENECSKDEDVDEEEPNQLVPGMDMKGKSHIKTHKKESIQTFKTEKDVKKVLKKQATKNVQKSKAFQMKNKIEKQKQKKKSFKEKKERIKLRNEQNKKRGRRNKN